MRRRARAFGTLGHSLAAVAAAAMAAAGCRDPAAPRMAYDLVESFPVARVALERAVVDVGDPASRPFLERGFASAERSQDGTTFCWSRGALSVARFDLHTTSTRVVALRGFPHPSAAEREAIAVEVLVNDQPLGSVTLRSGIHTYSIAAPANALRLGANRLSLRYALDPETDQRSRRRTPTAGWDALALLEPGPAADVEARLDAALARAATNTTAGAVLRRGELLLRAGAAARWSVDVGPSAELVLELGEPIDAEQDARLAVWLEHPGTPVRVLADAVTSRTFRAQLALERWDTVELTLAALASGDGVADPAVGVRRAEIVYPISSPSGAPVSLPRGRPRAGGAPPR